jgi:hypothetical protein
MKKRKNPTDSSSYTQPQDLPASKHFKASDTASKHHNDNSSSIPLSTITNTVFRNLQPPLASPLIHIHPSETPVVTIPTAEHFTPPLPSSELAASPPYKRLKSSSKHNCKVTSSIHVNLIGRHLKKQASTYWKSPDYYSSFPNLILSFVPSSNYFTCWYSPPQLKQQKNFSCLLDLAQRIILGSYLIKFVDTEEIQPLLQHLPALQWITPNSFTSSIQSDSELNSTNFRTEIGHNDHGINRNITTLTKHSSSLSNQFVIALCTGTKGDYSISYTKIIHDEPSDSIKISAEEHKQKELEVLVERWRVKYPKAASENSKEQINQECLHLLSQWAGLREQLRLEWKSLGYQYGLTKNLSDSITSAATLSPPDLTICYIFSLFVGSDCSDLKRILPNEKNDYKLNKLIACTLKMKNSKNLKTTRAYLEYELGLIENIRNLRDLARSRWLKVHFNYEGEVRIKVIVLYDDSITAFDKAQAKFCEDHLNKHQEKAHSICTTKSNYHQSLLRSLCKCNESLFSVEIKNYSNSFTLSLFGKENSFLHTKYITLIKDKLTFPYSCTATKDSSESIDSSLVGTHYRAYEAFAKQSQLNDFTVVRDADNIMQFESSDYGNKNVTPRHWDGVHLFKWMKQWLDSQSNPLASSPAPIHRFADTAGCYHHPILGGHYALHKSALNCLDWNAEQFTSSMRDFILQDAARGFNYGTDERFLKQVVYKRIMKKEQLLQSLNKIIPCSLLESTHFHMKPNNNDKPPEVCKPSQNTLQWNDLLLQAHLLYSQLIKKKKNKKNTQEIDWICQKAYDKVIDKVSLNFCLLDNLHKARQVVTDRLKLLLNS